MEPRPPAASGVSRTTSQWWQGFIDLLRLDTEWLLHIIETKIGHHGILVLQGLDYWIWAQANGRALSVEMHGAVEDLIVDFVVSLPGWQTQPLTLKTRVPETPAD